MRKGILTRIKEYIVQQQEEKKRMEEEYKHYIISTINKKMSEAEIKYHNQEIGDVTNYWLGDYSENDIKEAMLRHNSDLFTNE